jgi:hypothetical protein
MIVVDHLFSGQLFGNDDSKTVFESKLEISRIALGARFRTLGVAVILIQCY